MPRPTSMIATNSSKTSAIRAGISARRTTSDAPTMTSESVWPTPHEAPSIAARTLLRSPVTSVDTAGASAERVQIPPAMRLFLLTGILGGFTTFSSYAFETFVLMRDGQMLWAAINVAGQVVAGLVGMWAGYVITY